MTIAVVGTRWAISPAAATPPPRRSTSRRQRRGVVATHPASASSAVWAVPHTRKPAASSVTATAVQKVVLASATNTVGSERSTTTGSGTGLLRVLRLGRERTVRGTWWEEGDMTPPAASTLRYRMRARQGAAVAALVGAIATVVAAVLARGRAGYHSMALSVAVDTALALVGVLAAAMV